MRLGRFGRWLSSGSMGLVLLASAHAAETKPGCDTSKGAKGSAAQQACNPEAVKKDVPAVITNEYLERLFGPAEPPKKETTSQAAGGEAPSDPLKAMAEEQDHAREQQTLAADRDKKIVDAQARVKELERQVLEQKNPLLPRPKISKDEAEAQKGMNNQERVTRTQEQLEQARKDLEKLQNGTSARSGT